jgi:translocation and assembly module TamB
MKRLRRVLRLTLFAFLLVVVLASGVLAILTLTQPGRDMLAGLISDMASTETSTVRIGGISGIWSGQLKLDHVTLEDADGPWLVARNVEADWSPFSLLGETVTANRISAERVELARLPKGGDDSEPFSLPVSLDITTIDLPKVLLGQALAGGVAEVAATGSLKANREPLRISTELKVERRDGRAGFLTAAIDFAPDQNLLDIDVAGSEPAGGVLANFLRLPGAPSVDVAISGSGPVSNWKGEGTFSADGKVVTQVSAIHQNTARGNRVEAKGNGSFEQFIPEDFRPLLAGQTSFDIAGTVLARGGIDIERAELSGTATAISAAGQYDPRGATDLSVTLAAASTPVDLVVGSDDAPIRLAIQRATVRAFGAGEAPALDATIRLAGLYATDLEATGIDAVLHSDAFDLAAQTGPIRVNATAETVGAADQTLASLLAGTVSVQTDATVGAERIDIASGTLTSGTQDSRFSGFISRADGSFSFDVEANVLSTALPAATRPVLAERTGISATVSRDSAGGISANALSLRSGDFEAKGSVALNGETLEASLEGAMGDISRLAQGTSGAISFTAKASGNRSAPDLALTVSSDRFTAAGREITRLEVTATGVANAAAPAADVTIKGTVAGEALAGSATLKTENGQRDISGLTLTLGENRIAGDLSLDASFLPQGTLDLVIPNLGSLAALALEEAEGDVTGTIRFGGVDGVPEIVVDANTKSLTRGDLVASGVSVKASVRNYLVSPAVSGKVTAGSVKSGTTEILGLDLTLGRDGDWTSFNGGATVAGIPAKAVGRARFVDGATTVELASGEAIVRGLKATLARPSKVTVKGGETSLDRLAFSLGGGRVEVTGSAGASLNLDVQVASMPATVVDSFSPGLGATGTISGTARVTGAPSNPTVGYTIDWRSAQTSQTRSAGFGPITVASTGTLANGRLKLTANAGDGSGLGLKGGGEVVTTGTRTMSLDFSGTVPFSFLTGRLAAQGLSLSGGASVSLTVRGGMTSPAVGGTIRSSGARFIDARSGIAVNDIDAEIALANGVATVRRLTGSLSGGGSISGSGTVAVDAARGFPADLTFRIADGRYTDGQLVTTTLSGDIAVKGPLSSAPLLSGTINLGKTVIQVPDRLPASLATVGVQHRNAPAAVRRQEEAIRPASAGNGGSGGLALDLTVNAPQQIFIQGRGLDAELGGSVRLTGPAGAPSAIGTFTLRRGRLALLGRRLTFTRGTLGFSGSLVPYLDLAADSTATDATVTVLVTGPATNPKFAFSSVPSLPEDEVLARLVFGKAMSNLSPLQIAQLADAVATLAGVGGTSGLLDTLRGKAGIDDLDVKTDERGKAAVSVGKYLNDRTYVTIEKGEGAGTGKATIDLDIGRGVKLRGEATDGGKAKGGIFYEREY